MAKGYVWAWVRIIPLEFVVVFSIKEIPELTKGYRWLVFSYIT